MKGGVACTVNGLLEEDVLFLGGLTVWREHELPLDTHKPHKMASLSDLSDRSEKVGE